MVDFHFKFELQQLLEEYIQILTIVIFHFAIFVRRNTSNKLDTWKKTSLITIFSIAVKQNRQWYLFAHKEHKANVMLLWRQTYIIASMTPTSWKIPDQFENVLLELFQYRDSTVVEL